MQNGGYKLSEVSGYFIQTDSVDIEEQNEDGQDAEGGVPQHKDSIDEDVMDFHGHSGGAHNEIDEDGRGEVENNGFLLTGAIKDGGFQYTPSPASLQEGILTGT